jgi:predicted enzyme related to lactoylglutathione lyase
MTKDGEFAPLQEGTTAYPIVGPDLSVPMAPVTAGGKIFASKTQINPEAGYRALFLDTKGSRMGLQ